MKARRYNDLVDEVQQRKTARLIDNMEPQHLERFDNYVTKQQNSMKQIAYIKETVESNTVQKQDEHN